MFSLRPVAADDAHQVDGREEAGGAGEMAGGAAKQIFAATRGGFNGVYGDRADDEQGHRQRGRRKGVGGRKKDPMTNDQSPNVKGL